MTINTLIVDDERLARSELKHLLSDSKFSDQINLVGEAANANEARTLLDKNAVDLLLLDIQMPEKNGFELLEELDFCPQVIFTTAFDQYAIDAFKANALDYLLKPIEVAELDNALAKAIALKSQEQQKPALTSTDKIFIKDGERCWFVPLNDICGFSSVGNYCRVLIKGDNPLIRKTMNQLEQRLPEEFFRISRQHIINTQHISNVETGLSGNLLVTLLNGNQLEMSRRQSQEFKEKMSL